MTALDDLFGSAAEARAQGVRAAADRPSQRRAGEDPGPAIVSVRAGITLERGTGAEPDGSGLTFDGFASVYNRGYEMWDMFGPYTEQVLSGAGAASLARSDLDVPFVLAHDSMRRIARTTNGTLALSEESVDDWDGEPAEGLRVRATLDPADPDVTYIAPKLDSGLIDEMSFRFSITSGEWSPDWMEYHIAGYEIHRGDVAIVGYGANPHTHGSGLRSTDLQSMTERQLAQLVDDLHREHQRRGLVPSVFVPPVRSGNSLGITRAAALAPLPLAP